jgi:hypothetical protein
MYIIQFLYLQNLIDEKLHKDKNSLRNIVGHIALSERLAQALQTEDDLERHTLSCTGSEGWGADTRETRDYDAGICCISEKFAAVTLNESGNNSEAQ